MSLKGQVAIGDKITLEGTHSVYGKAAGTLTATVDAVSVDWKVEAKLQRHKPMAWSFEPKLSVTLIESLGIYSKAKVTGTVNSETSGDATIGLRASF